MKKLLLLAMVFIFAISHPIYADDVTIFGLTLGKPIPSETKNNIIILDRNNRCYSQWRNPLSFPIEIWLVLEKDCDRGSIIKEVQVNFQSQHFEQLLSLVKEKFGKPSSIEDSVVQNAMGAKFSKVTAMWVLEGNVISLTNMKQKVTGWTGLDGVTPVYSQSFTEGYLGFTHSSLADERRKRLRDKTDSDKKKF